ncbi:MAG: hypothetical protein WAL38_03785 [Solirubrobacteraceae bacterium]
MTDLPSSLGIEAVELVSEGTRVTVRVTGRWRRRPAQLRGQAMLVVDGGAGRQRFLAMPEPPSLVGAAPGTWRMNFSVPADLAASLSGRTFLQFGGVMVPLPIGDVGLAVEADGGVDGEPPDLPDADLLEARRARSSELAAASARRRAAELAAQVDGLEHDLVRAREQSERLRASIGLRERRLRLAEQETHAERALRRDVEQELTLRTRAARHDLTALHERVADLERELTRTRRAVDEAQHLAAAAQAARIDAVRRLEEQRRLEERLLAPSPPPWPRADPTRRELDLYRAAGAVPTPAASPRALERPADAIALRQEAAIAESRATRAGAGTEQIAALEQELAAARVEIEEQRRRSDRAYAAIELVRTELRRLHLADPPGRSETSSPSPGPEEPAATLPTEAPGRSPLAGPVQPDQLSAALARLRERTPVSPPEEVSETAPPQSLPAAGATRPWLAGAFRALCAKDASGAGRLLLALLPAQRAADPQPVAYDLILSDLLVARVTVGSAAGHVEMGTTPRPASDVDFQLIGGLAGIARLLVAGPVRRRLSRVSSGRRMARLRGKPHRLAALDRLIDARLSVSELQAAGVRLDPVLAMTVAGLMIDPVWTMGERFVIAHHERGAARPYAYLHVRDGRPPLASGQSPHAPVEAVVVCPAADLLAVLAGAVRPVETVGEERPLTLLAQWLGRAQCG